MTHDDLISMQKPKRNYRLAQRTTVVDPKSPKSPLKMGNVAKSLDVRFSKLNAKLVSVEVPGIEDKTISDIKTAEPISPNSTRMRALRKA
jgi:hypothetical protein